MKLKELQSLLQDVADFEQPKQKLEQYLTGPHLASVIVHEVRLPADPAMVDDPEQPRNCKHQGRVGCSCPRHACRLPIATRTCLAAL